MGLTEVKSFASRIYARYSLIAADFATWVARFLRRAVRHAFETHWMYTDPYAVSLYMEYTLF